MKKTALCMAVAAAALTLAASSQAAPRAAAASKTLHLTAVVIRFSPNEFSKGGQSADGVGLKLLSKGKKVGATVHDLVCQAGPMELLCRAGPIRVHGATSDLYLDSGLDWKIPLCVTGVNCSKGATSATSDLRSSLTVFGGICRPGQTCAPPKMGKLLGHISVATTAGTFTKLHSRFAVTINLS